MGGKTHPSGPDKGLVQKLRNYFSGQPMVEMAFLFGSEASDRVHSGSDVDVAVYLEKGYEYQDVLRLWGELEDLTGRDIDLVVLDHAAPGVAWTAIRGIPLVIRDYRLYLNYMLDVSREAEDFQGFVRELWEMRRRRRRS